jgi:pSer/pThr/pTyr-binding forkhead associated (FHA) protein
MPFCNKCGHDNPAEARFCSHCGNALRTEASADQTSMIPPAKSAETEERESFGTPEEAAAVAALRPGTALLVVRTGPDAGSRYMLDKPVVSAGRHQTSEIFLDDVTVSRRHAEFVRGDHGYVLKDVGSLNGTYVNRDRIDELQLGNEDEVQIGKFRLVYLTPPEGPTST